MNGSSGGIHIDSFQLPANAIQTAGAVLPVTDPGIFPFAGIQLTLANANGNFAGTGGTMPLPGVAKICLFSPCASATANVTVPLSVVGTPAAVAIVGPGVNVTVNGAPWTTGTAALGHPSSNFTAMGFRHGAASGTSSTGAPSGELQLVTPILISTNVGSFAVIPAFAILTLHFVPEPATMLLLGGGLSLLAVVGRRQMHAR